MKRLLLLTPLFLAACSGQQAIDLTTEEPFQITCTWTRGEKSGDETWIIDPKLDVAVNEFVQDGKEEEGEYDVLKVTPKRIVLGDEWFQFTNEDGSSTDWVRNEIHINRSTGELTFKEFGLKKSVSSYPTVAAGWKGEEQELAFDYDCQKPKR